MPEVYTKDGPVWREFKPFDPATAPLPPPAPWPWRLPVVRHIRAIWTAWKIDRHYAAWGSIGALPVNAEYDRRCVEAIWRGEL